MCGPNASEGNGTDKGKWAKETAGAVTSGPVRSGMGSALGVRSEETVVELNAAGSRMSHFPYDADPVVRAESGRKGRL